MDDAAGFGAGVLAVVEDLCAVDEDVLHAGGVLVGLGVGRAIGDGVGIEDDEVGVVAFFQSAPPVELQIAGRQ